MNINKNLQILSDDEIMETFQLFYKNTSVEFIQRNKYAVARCVLEHLIKNSENPNINLIKNEIRTAAYEQIKTTIKRVLLQRMITNKK